jgi:hypothetical protein
MSDVTTRAEIASLDRIRNVSVELQDHSKPRAGDSVPARGKHCANVIFKRSSFVIAAQSVTFQTSVTFRTWVLRKARLMVRMPRHATKRRARPNKGGCAMLVESIKSPQCPKCGETMSLRIIEPERPGFDSRTFECPRCFGTETLVASISSEAEVSIAPSLASAATSPPRLP